MKWRVEDSCEIELHSIDQTRIVKVKIKRAALRDVAIGMSLLHEKLVVATTFVDQTGRRAFTLTRGKQSGTYAGTVSWHGNNATLELSPTELEMVSVFCLRTIRDGIAEVDHIDFDTDGATFVLMFPEASQPVSASEARKRLGL